MPPSQLKQLKASLRDNGILGPQKSKKQKKQNNKDAAKRLQRNAALEGIREKFNPFETKAPARKEKFDIASNKPTKRTIERPGVTRGLGEERRRATLLKEIQSRNKVGGMLDRRFGEDDPNMTPEQKAAERFAQQSLRQGRKNNLFNLEGDDDEELMLTHGGRALNLDERRSRLRDDFQEDLSGSDAGDFEAQDDRPTKRVRLEGANESGAEDNGEDVPERKKTKNEVMQEVMAKSKAYKAARQAQKEDDEDLREELNKGMSNMFTALINHKPPPKQLPSPPITDSEPTLDPARAAMLAGKSREEAEKEYELNIRQMKLDARSKPTVRTKTDEEKAAEEKARLGELERKRERRMKGEAESSEDESDDGGADADIRNEEDAENADDAEAFGLEQPGPRYIPNLAVEDEDEFVVDDIIASDSEADLASDFGDDDDSSNTEPEDDGDDDFINGLVLPQRISPAKPIRIAAPKSRQETAYTFSCPQTVHEIVEVMEDVPSEELAIAVQRIRALYHKGLAPENEERLGKFAQAMIPWIAELVDYEVYQNTSMKVIEQLLRHLHSMAKAQPHEVAAGFREYLRRFLQEDRRSLSAGDLVILTAINNVFPTSDQWHSVVTPANLVLARYLGQYSFETLSDLARGAYACSLILRYQARSERYIPEAVNFICKGILLLAPDHKGAKTPELTTPKVMERGVLRIMEKSSISPSYKLNFQDLRTADGKRPIDDEIPTLRDMSTITPESVLLNILNCTIACLDYYTQKSAFPEIIAPLTHLVLNLSHPSNLSLLDSSTRLAFENLSQLLPQQTKIAVGNRKPLLLHRHRPLAIKSAWPLFSETYNPTRKQRDPDEERAEMNKLKAEHKKEKKGAVRELRKDANFMAREQLREKKAKDEAYDKKFKRLVAEIQGEEGREAKEYAREKNKRKGRF